MSGVVLAGGVLPARAWRLRLPGTLAGGVALAGLILLACTLGQILWGADPSAIDPLRALKPPSWQSPFGTDELGRDELARLLSGGFSTLLVSLPAAAVAFVVGTAYGLASALSPRWLDRVLMRLLDVVLALPVLVVLIFCASLLTLSTWHLVLLIGLVSWSGLARLVRNEAIAIGGRDFVAAARQMGASNLYIARTHLVRVMGPLLVVNATFLVGDAIFGLSALSFLGLGVQPPRASWGELLQKGLSLSALQAWWLILPPGLAIFGALLAASLIGQGLLKRSEGGR